MPRSRYQQFPNLFVEIVLFVSLFTLLGHVTINFWERYTIQTELTKMKTSLHGLRYTIDIIGNAYDSLHREIKVLADVTVPTKSGNGKTRSIYTDNIPKIPPSLNLAQPNHHLAHSDSDGGTNNRAAVNIPETTKVIHDIYAQGNINGQEQFTITDIAEKVDKLLMTPSIRDNVQNTDTLETSDREMKTSFPTTVKRVIPLRKSAKTNTRNPLVSTAAGRGPAHDRAMQTFGQCKKRDHYTSKIHQYHKDEIVVNG